MRPIRGTVLGEHAYGQYASMLQQVQMLRPPAVGAREHVDPAVAVRDCSCSSRSGTCIMHRIWLERGPKLAPRSTDAAEQGQQPAGRDGPPLPAAAVRHHLFGICAARRQLCGVCALVRCKVLFTGH